MKNVLKWIVILLVVVLAVGAIYVAVRWPGWVEAGFPQTDGELKIAGLDGPVDIYRDENGVPHIYASTLYDAFFVQGFNAARDRLFQIDLWRRRGLGQLSEVFGPGFVEKDRAARLFLYRGDMYSEWLAYGSDAKRIAHD